MNQEMSDDDAKVLDLIGRLDEHQVRMCNCDRCIDIRRAMAMLADLKWPKVQEAI